MLMREQHMVKFWDLLAQYAHCKGNRLLREKIVSVLGSMTEPDAVLEVSYPDQQLLPL
jgi:hypothetical protein